jgi:hypothetical protein
MTLLGVRLPESVRKRLEAEGIKRHVSIQEMVRCGLELYFSTPEEWTNVEMKFSEDDPAISRREADRLNTLANLWEAYVDQMPAEKVDLVAETLKLDLLHYGSSRRKTAKGRRVRLR